MCLWEFSWWQCMPCSCWNSGRGHGKFSHPFPPPPFSGEAVLGQSAWQRTNLAEFTSWPYQNKWDQRLVVVQVTGATCTMLLHQWAFIVAFVIAFITALGFFAHRRAGEGQGWVNSERNIKGDRKIWQKKQLWGASLWWERIQAVDWSNWWKGHNLDTIGPWKCDFPPYLPF